jgi:signal transduction histidine kinase
LLQDGTSLPIQVTSIDLVAVVREAVDRHQHLADGHEIVLDLGPESLPGLWDGARLVRVFDNLLGNAIKYSPEGGSITVTVTCGVAPAGNEPRDGVVVSVEDSGIGIDEHDLPHIFDRFHRGGNVPETVVGSGIGLASVEQIVHQHGGTVKSRVVSAKVPG